MTDQPSDPIRKAAEIITQTAAADDDADTLERRLKLDIFNSIGRIKPNMVADVDFDADVLNGDFFATLPAPLQGIAIARCEGALAFYNRIGWHSNLLTDALHLCVPEEGLDPLSERYHAGSLHDLAYVHPKHFEKMLGKPGSASLWETLKQHVTKLQKDTQPAQGD